MAFSARTITTRQANEEGYEIQVSVMALWDAVMPLYENIMALSKIKTENISLPFHSFILLLPKSRI